MKNIEELLLKNKDITDLSNFKTKATTSYYYEIKTRQDLDNVSKIYKFSIDKNIEVLFIWWGTNMLFAFDNFDWIVIKNCLKWWSYDQVSKFLYTNAWEYISEIALSLYMNYKQNIWKRFIWLPWTIWWAIYWNAWCFWLETQNNFLEAELLDLNTWELLIKNKDQMEFDYRNSLVKKDSKYFIISAIFDLNAVIEKYSSDVDNIYFREVKQPKGNTCWSFFKNPSKDFSAGKLIEMVWLKWKKYWWAFFSDIHANFLMSDGTATYKDLLELVKIAIQEVKNLYGYQLIPEVRIITNKSK